MADLRETCIERIEGTDYCCISTSERKFINKLNKLAEEHPDEVNIHHVNDDGSMVAHVPFDWMVFPKPKAKRNLTEEQKEELRKRMAKARAKKEEE